MSEKEPSGAPETGASQLDQDSITWKLLEASFARTKSNFSQRDDEKIAHERAAARVEDLVAQALVKGESGMAARNSLVRNLLVFVPPERRDDVARDLRNQIQTWSNKDKTQKKELIGIVHGRLAYEQPTPVQEEPIQEPIKMEQEPIAQDPNVENTETEESKERALDEQLVRLARLKATERKAGDPNMTDEEALKHGAALVIASLDSLTKGTAKERAKAATKFSGKLAGRPDGSVDEELQAQIQSELEEYMAASTTRAAKKERLKEARDKIFAAGPEEDQSPNSAPTIFAPEGEPDEAQQSELATFLGRYTESTVAEYAAVPHDDRETWVADWMNRYGRAGNVSEYRDAFDELLANHDEHLSFASQEAADQPETENGEDEPEWVKNARILDFEPDDLDIFLREHMARANRGEGEQFKQEWIQHKLEQRYPDDTGDVDAFKEVLREVYAQAFDDLINDEGDIPTDLDVLAEMMQEAPEEEVRFLTGIRINLSAGLRRLGDVGEAIWNAPLSLVTRAQVGLSSLLGRRGGGNNQNVPLAEAEKLKMQRKVAVVLVGAATLVLLRTTRVVPSIEELMDMVDFSSDAPDVNAPGGSESPAAGAPEGQGEGEQNKPARETQQAGGENAETGNETGGETPGQTGGGTTEVGGDGPTTSTELYKPKGDTWWDIAEELLKDAKKSGDIDTLDNSKRQAVIEALQAANPDGIKQEGIDIKSATAAIETMKAEDVTAAQTIEATTTIYEAHRGDTVEKITDRLLDVHGVDNPDEALRSAVEQAIIDNNYTYNGSAHWIDQGQNIHMEAAQEVIDDFLNPEVPENTGDVVPAGTGETPTPPEVVETPDISEANIASEGGAFAEALAGVADRVNASQVVENIVPGQDWNDVLRNYGIPFAIGTAILVKVGPQLVKDGYAERIDTFNKLVVGNKPITHNIINAIQQMALKVMRR